MLKIKDDVDLKELEKFGFEHKKRDNSYQYFPENSDQAICIYNDKTIGAIDYNPSLGIGEIINELDILYDLIQADLVEKVEE